MKKLAKVLLVISSGCLATYFIKEYGYRQGVMDVLKDKNIDSFTQKLSSGSTMTYYKPE